MGVSGQNPRSQLKHVREDGFNGNGLNLKSLSPKSKVTVGLAAAKAAAALRVNLNMQHRSSRLDRRSSRAALDLRPWRGLRNSVSRKGRPATARASFLARGGWAQRDRFPPLQMPR